MMSRGWIYTSNNNLIDSASFGPSYDNWYFALDMTSQNGGPSLLESEITINGITESPIIALFASDATTSSWANRGSLGGTLTAVNIRPEDLGHDTPFTDGSTAVRFHSVAGGTRRYYQAPDATWGDIDTEDFYFEAIFSRDMPVATTSTADAIVFTKRNESSSSTVGFTMHGVSATTFTFTARPAADAKRTAAVTTTARSWQHISGYFDNSDSTADGMRTFMGSQTTNTVAHTPGSLTNALIATIGDAPNWGVPNALEVNFKLVYLAIYKRASWLPGGATNNTEVSALIRQRQMVLAGMVPQKGTATPLVSTWTYHQSQRVVDGYVHNYSCGTGFAAPNESILASTGLPVKNQEFNSATAGLATTETFTDFTHTNTTAAASLIDPPQNPTQGVAGQGISQTGAAGTAVKNSKIAASSNSSLRRLLWQIYFKANTAPFFYMMTPDTVDGTNRHVWVDTATGATTLGSGAFGVKVQKCQGGWYRAHLSFTSVATITVGDIFFTVGFSDNNTTFNLTSDGTTIDGWLWGHYRGTIASGAATYPAQFFPYSANTANNIGAVIQFNGADVTGAPYTLWSEIFSRDQVPNASSTNQGTIIYGTDSLNFTQGPLVVNSGTFQRIDSGGTAAGAAQWAITGTPTTTSGVNNVADGGLVRGAVSCATNDIKLYANDGTLLGSDAAATVPTGCTKIWVGSLQNDTIVGRGYQISRCGCYAGVKTDSSGPT
jgi:hypothetical protein